MLIEQLCCEQLGSGSEEGWIKWVLHIPYRVRKHYSLQVLQFYVVYRLQAARYGVVAFVASILFVCSMKVLNFVPRVKQAWCMFQLEF